MYIYLKGDFLMTTNKKILLILLPLLAMVFSMNVLVLLHGLSDSLIYRFFLSFIHASLAGIVVYLIVKYLHSIRYSKVFAVLLFIELVLGFILDVLIIHYMSQNLQAAPSVETNSLDFIQMIQNIRIISSLLVAVSGIGIIIGFKNITVKVIGIPVLVILALVNILLLVDFNELNFIDLYIDYRWYFRYIYGSLIMFLGIKELTSREETNY